MLNAIQLCELVCRVKGHKWFYSTGVPDSKFAETRVCLRCFKHESHEGFRTWREIG